MVDLGILGALFMSNLAIYYRLGVLSAEVKIIKQRLNM